MNLANWSLLENFKAKGKSECTSISWNPSKDKGHGLMLAVGTKPVGEVVQSSVGIWELQDTRRWSLVTEKFSEITEAVHDVVSLRALPKLTYGGRGRGVVAAVVAFWFLAPPYASSTSSFRPSLTSRHFAPRLQRYLLGTCCHPCRRLLRILDGVTIYLRLRRNPKYTF